MTTYWFWDFGVESDKGKIEYDVPEEIKKASKHFLDKFGVHPDICKISTNTKGIDSILEFDGHVLTISRDSMVASKNLWLGLSDESKELKSVDKVIEPEEILSKKKGRGRPRKEKTL